MLAIYISVPVCTLCGRVQNIDEKYDQCILYYLRLCHQLGSKASWLMLTNSQYYTAAPTRYFTLGGTLNQQCSGRGVQFRVGVGALLRAEGVIHLERSERIRNHRLL